MCSSDLAAGESIRRQAAGAALEAGQTEDMKKSLRQADSLGGSAEACLDRSGRAARTARLLKSRVSRLRDALGVFRLR